MQVILRNSDGTIISGHDFVGLIEVLDEDNNNEELLVPARELLVLARRLKQVREMNEKHQARRVLRAARRAEQCEEQ